MRNLVIGLVLGVMLGVATSTLVAQRRADAFPDAVTADPKHYSVSFENDVARFLRVKYGPGEKSVMHRHLPGCVDLPDLPDFQLHAPGWDHRACLGSRRRPRVQ